MKQTATLAFLLATACGGYAQPAPQHPSEAEDKLVDLSAIVVTATRTPKALKDVPVQTRIITAEDIRRTDATNIQDVLQQELPGVEFSYAMNQQINMNLAGFAGQSVLILVDGERLAGETMDNVDFSRLTMNGIARIEIVKGAASALYGSNAAGGVINIITREADKKWRANVNGHGGSHGEWRAGAEVAAKGKHIANVLGLNYYTIDTYSVCNDAADECDFRNVYGFTTYNVSDRLTVRPTERLKLTARAGYFFKERLYNPDTPDRYRDYSGGLRGEWQISDRSDLEVAYSFDQYDKSDYLKARGLDIRDYSNVQNSFRALFNHHFTDAWLLTAGGDVARDYLATYQFADGEARQQTTADVFTQIDWTANRHWELVGALRYDYYSDSHDSRLTTKLNARYRLGRLTLRAGFAQGFRAPTLKERYMQYDMASIFDIHGNPALRPETSQNFNLSAEYTYQSYNFTLGANYTLVNDKISTSGILYDAQDKPYIDYINVDRLRVFGIDATARARWSYGLSASLAYNYTHEQTRGGSVSQYCPARPHSIKGNVTWGKQWAKNYHTDLTLSGRFLSAVSYTSMYMYEPFATKPIHNPSYAIFKLQLSQQFGRGIQLIATADNLLNYKPSIYTFNSPITTGASFQLSLNIEL